MKTVRQLLTAGVALLFLSGCEPDVGSEAWCEEMESTPKGDWTMNATSDYAKHCLLKLDDAET